MSRKILYPYKMGSKSCRELAKEIGAIRVYPNRSYRPRSSDIIINWGNSIIPEWSKKAQYIGATILNEPLFINLASNKLSTFLMLRDAGIPIPQFTEEKQEALKFNGIYVRTKLQGHSGQGIQYLEEGSYEEINDIPDAPLYTEKINTKSEYRIHVFNGEVISYAKKRRRKNFEEQVENRELIRSYDNGWVFCRENLRRLEKIEKIAIEAVEALGLDFGGVDVVKDQENQVYVLEVNSACSLQGETLESYKNIIKNTYA